MNGRAESWLRTLLPAAGYIAASIIFTYSTFVTQTQYIADHAALDRALTRIETQLDGLDRKLESLRGPRVSFPKLHLPPPTKPRGLES